MDCFDCRQDVDSELSALLGGVAHTLRNPLFGISATLDAFETRHGDNADFDKYFTVLRTELDRVTALIQALSDYGRPAELNPTRQDAGSIVNKAIQSCISLAQKSQVNIEKHMPPNLSPMLVDEIWIIKALEQVIRNAIEHTPPEKTVSVAVSEENQAEKSYLVCMVSDPGPGFNEGDIEKAFDPFFSRNSRKFGLGLTIAQRLVRAHKGEITLQNQPPGGALVTIRLPLQENEPTD